MRGTEGGIEARKNEVSRDEWYAWRAAVIANYELSKPYSAAQNFFCDWWDDLWDNVPYFRE